MSTDPSYLETLIKKLEHQVEDLGARKATAEKSLSDVEERMKDLDREIEGKKALLKSTEKELAEFNQRRLDAEEASAKRIEEKKAE